MSHLDWALRYAGMGWAILPLEERSKEPNGRLVPHGLKDASKDPTVITRWWTEYPQANIGIATGEISGLCVLDVDPAKGGGDSLDKLAQRYGKPNTAISLTGGGGYHYLFAANGARIRNSAGRLGPGLDVRGEGGYIVAPPSIHPRTGLRYEWKGSSDPMEGFPLADSAFLTLPLDDTQPQRAAPTNGGRIKEGGRNQHLASLAGTMRRRGMSATAIEQALLAENRVHCDPPLGDPEVRQIAHSVSRYEPSSRGDTGEVFEEAADDHDAQPQTPPIPAHLLMIPGLLGQAVNYILETAPKPQPVFAVQGALALGALACGRRYRSSNNNFTNLWIAIVGPSGSGKEHIQAAIECVMQSVDMDDAIIQGGYTSEGAVDSALVERPNHLVIIDELGKHLAAIHSDHASPHLRMMVKHLMELYGRSGGVFKRKQYSTLHMHNDQAQAMKVRIEHPCISLLGTTTPETFYSNLSQRSIEDGFLARFILRETDEALQGFDHKLHRTPPPPDLLRWIEEVRTQFNGPADHALSAERVKNVPMLEEALDVFKAMERHVIEIRNENKDISELFGRTVENAMRVAVIVAASVCAREPIIDAEIAEWSAQYMMDAAIRLLDIAKRFGQASDWWRAQQSVLGFIQKFPNGTTKRNMARHCRAFRNLKPLDKNAMLFDLREAGQISIEETARPGGTSILIRALSSKKPSK